MTRPHLSSLGLVVGLCLSSTAAAGGMFHGVRCGEGATLDEAVSSLNERIDKGSYAEAVHSSLVTRAHGDRHLACVLVNRRLRDLEGGKPKVKCLTKSWASLAENSFGFYYEGDRGGWLTSLALTVEPAGDGAQVTACALAQPTKP